MEREPDVDVAVVGGGPAGLSAALWVARYRRSVVLLDSGTYRAEAVERSHGYLGRDPQHPMELLERGRAELLAYPTASIRRGEVATATSVGDGFALDGLRARRVILACGVRDVLPEIEGFADHYGSSAFHCASCDGYEARDRHVIALGWGEQILGFAASLLTWARSVTVLTNGHALTEADARTRARLADLGIDLVEDRVASLVGTRGDLQAVELTSGRRLPTSMLFFSIAHEPRVSLAIELGCALDSAGYVCVNSCGETTLPGAYAAGDLVPGLQLVAVAAASGVVAGVASAQSLS